MQLGVGRIEMRAARDERYVVSGARQLRAGNRGEDRGMNGFSFRRFGAVLYKEFIQMRRDHITFGMMIGLPLVLLVVGGTTWMVARMMSRSRNGDRRICA